MRCAPSRNRSSTSGTPSSRRIGSSRGHGRAAIGVTDDHEYPHLPRDGRVREAQSPAGGTYAPNMTERAERNAIIALDAADAASPVEAVETVTRELGLVLEATKVSFLIADLSGRALLRLAYVELSAALDGTVISAPIALDERPSPGGVRKSATVLQLDSGPAEQTIRTQQVEVVHPDSLRLAP